MPRLVKSVSFFASQTDAVAGFGRRIDVFESCKMRADPTFKLSWHTAQAVLNGSGRILHNVPKFKALISNVTTYLIEGLRYNG